ncbi:MAG: hypothetical protein JWL76_1392 [Thermoleophilia bacterium]|nr:hypothetical protein [Thermoleophilia bacterium]
MPGILSSTWIRVRAYVGASLLVLAVVVATLLVPASARAATAPWTNITSPGGTSATINPIPDITWDGTGLWAAWGTDTLDVEVRRWNGSAWTAYPQPVNETTRNKMPSITWDGARPWVTWNDDTFAVQVAYWNGSAWVNVASPGSGTSINSTPDILYANGAVHIAWQDSGRVVRVARWTGSAWVAIASPGNGGTANAYPNLGWDGSNLFVAWAQPSTVLVSKLVGAAWTAHSSLASGTGSNPLPAIEFVGSRLYLAYEATGSTSGLAWWDGAQFRTSPAPGGGPTVFTYPSLAWTGSRFYMSYVVDPDDVAIASYDPVVPNAPTLASLSQREADGTTIVGAGAWTRFGGALNLLLRSTMVDPQSSEQLLPWVEVQPNASAFAATCGQQLAGATWAGSQVAAPTGGTGVTGIGTVTGLINNTAYKWRSCVVDRFGFTSGWTANGGSPDLRIDTSVPTAAPSVPASAATGVSTTPALDAAYADPAPANAGTVDYEVCTTNACGSVVQSGTSASTASGATASWTVPSALATSTTYWWRTRATDIAGNVGSWSATRSFTTAASSLTITVNNATVALGTTYAGADATGTSDVTVTTDSPGGYQLVARDESDTWGADSAGGATVPDWTGTAAVPTTWTAGTSGGFGMTVLGATGPAAKHARWGTGTLPTDFVTNRYAGLDQTVDGPVHTRTSLSLPADTVTVGWRVNVGAGQAAGSYGATVVWTATALP